MSKPKTGTKPKETSAKTGSNILKPVPWRDPILTAIMAVLTLIIALFTSGTARLDFKGSTGWFDLGVVALPSEPIVWACALIAVAAGLKTWLVAFRDRTSLAWLLGLGAAALVVAFIIWTVAGKEHSLMPIVPLLAGGLSFAVPLIFGAMSGLLCERSGIINIAIEGQLLFGAFAGAVLASMSGNPYVGLLFAPLGGVLAAALLALFTVYYRADHIIIGTVLNMLILGLTSFLYGTLLKSNPEVFNSSQPLGKIRIPVLADIPVIGPVLFNQTILVYLMYVAVIVLQFMLFNSRWGLRLRSSGEHPRAADTVGIKVNLIRWQAVLLGGALAGLGGAFFSIGQGLAFTKNMAAGNGFIALAAMILGRWNPKGAVAAALLFGFATNLGVIMQSVNSPIPSEFLLMIPYIITILAVAGFVGGVRAPAAEGKPYPL